MPRQFFKIMIGVYERPRMVILVVMNQNQLQHLAKEWWRAANQHSCNAVVFKTLSDIIVYNL